jgi:hypothetical protein
MKLKSEVLKQVFGEYNATKSSKGAKEKAKATAVSRGLVFMLFREYYLTYLRKSFPIPALWYKRSPTMAPMAA